MSKPEIPENNDQNNSDVQTPELKKAHEKIAKLEQFIQDPTLNQLVSDSKKAEAEKKAKLEAEKTKVTEQNMKELADKLAKLEGLLNASAEKEKQRELDDLRAKILAKKPELESNADFKEADLKTLRLLNNITPAPTEPEINYHTPGPSLGDDKKPLAYFKDRRVLPANNEGTYR